MPARASGGSLPLSHCLVKHNHQHHSADFKNKKVVLVAVPGAFTPLCQGKHVVSYTENIDKLKAKGVDEVVIISVNDAFVMSAWGKANGILDEYIVSGDGRLYQCGLR